VVGSPVLAPIPGGIPLIAGLGASPALDHSGGEVAVLGTKTRDSGADDADNGVLAKTYLEGSAVGTQAVNVITPKANTTVRDMKPPA